MRNSNSNSNSNSAKEVVVTAYAVKKAKRAMKLALCDVLIAINQLDKLPVSRMSFSQFGWAEFYYLKDGKVRKGVARTNLD